MSEIVRRWRVLWIGWVACFLLSASSLVGFYYFPAAGDAVGRHPSLLLGLIVLLASPLLWLEFGISWALVGTSGERWIRVVGALVFPALIVAAATGLYLNPASVDQLVQPVGWIWMFSIGMRFAHVFVVMQAAKSD